MATQKSSKESNSKFLSEDMDLRICKDCLPKWMDYLNNLLTLKPSDSEKILSEILHDIPEEGKLKKIDKTLREGLRQGSFEVYVGSQEPDGKRLYFHEENVPVGVKNAKRELKIAFKSSETEDNQELLHLLHNKNRHP
jgi:hypothetical protein